MIQETKPDVDVSHHRTLPTFNRTKEQSLTSDTTETLPAMNLGIRVGPKFPAEASFTTPVENNDAFKKGLHVYYIWMLSRAMSSQDKQTIPGLGGFISCTGVPPQRKSTINYYVPINQPITQYEVVQELLRKSEEASAEVGQTYTINTFDLGVCMKALPLLWKFPDRYSNHLVLIGQFYTAMNYMGMLTNHKCRGSGYSEILLEAQLVTSGCLKSVLSGKAYAKALFCLKTVCESLERLLLERFIQEEEIQLTPEALLNLISSCDQENLDLALRDESTHNVISRLFEY
ncbi:uncharacterized protein [Argopecten irradians]|uniref:uncharacterized protein n=1 Tax=Argopecten irradians TaxID=31199 RepID=UPI003712E314